jgi:hypothetical protein
MGARFMHRPTGFQLDLLQIESVPQAFTWVKTFATSDQGEPHTQEHLLLLRGVRGRTLATKGLDVARDELGLHRDLAHELLLQHRRGHRHLLRRYASSSGDAASRLQRRGDPPRGAQLRRHEGRRRQLRLEEKGTVYNEMVASMANGAWQAYKAQNHALYGSGHPLSFNQGGEPAGIRTMTPEDIRRFHAATHHLATWARSPRSRARRRSTTCWRASTRC